MLCTDEHSMSSERALAWSNDGAGSCLPRGQLWIILRHRPVVTPPSNGKHLPCWHTTVSHCKRLPLSCCRASHRQRTCRLSERASNYQCHNRPPLSVEDVHSTTSFTLSRMLSCLKEPVSLELKCPCWARMPQWSVYSQRAPEPSHQPWRAWKCKIPLSLWPSSCQQPF